jgi:hypothetical protein
MRTAYLDRTKGEVVNKTPRVNVISYLASMYESLEVGSVPEFELGEILSDSRGSGSMQKADAPLPQTKKTV